ncbi:toll/interleukin-1 receptor domain-containing protein [Phormidium sp. FACHB-592]|nr:toll/interleukin-1 receptor domain-containing protein [Phormidium sp. FACHB-592]MBD2078313.1 toll/interleukin-1 receptor domain-containing protein [Phormidium sp. FACHB-592]
MVAQMSDGTLINSVEGQVVHIGDNIYQFDQETGKQVFQEKYGDPVQGLNALAALMQLPEVQKSVTTFRVVFEAACQQIDVIANYKALHDLLHKLELHCYNGIVQESKRLSENSTALVSLIEHDLTLKNLLRGIQKIEDSTILDNLIEHDLTLQNLLRSIQKIGSIETISTHDNQWLTKLQEAQVELHSATEKGEIEYLRRSIWLLNRVLAIQPSRINTQLTGAARSLRVPSLVNTMQSIVEKMADANLDQEKLQQFQQGVKSLGVLNSQLTALVSQHDNWQVFDLELRRIEANLDQDMNELEMSWPDLLEGTKGLFNLSTDQWMVTFQQNSQDLDTALKGQDPFITKRCFRVYCRQAKEHFYQVDLALKGVCEELREVGGAIASVLRMIE